MSFLRWYIKIAKLKMEKLFCYPQNSSIRREIKWEADWKLKYDNKLHAIKPVHNRQKIKATNLPTSIKTCLMLVFNIPFVIYECEKYHKMTCKWMHTCLKTLSFHLLLYSFLIILIDNTWSCWQLVYVFENLR